MYPIIFIIGVAGTGKSTIGKLLSEQLSVPFFDADDYHPQTNIDKMKKGIPLNDADREGWLQTLLSLAIFQQSLTTTIIVCSALKEKYRKIVSQHIAKAHWIYLYADLHVIKERLDKRSGHFLSPALLQSQYDILEIPNYGLHINVADTIEIIVLKIKINLATQL